MTLKQKTKLLKGYVNDLIPHTVKQISNSNDLLAKIDIYHKINEYIDHKIITKETYNKIRLDLIMILFSIDKNDEIIKFDQQFK